MNQARDFESSIAEIESVIEQLKGLPADKREGVDGQIAELELNLQKRREEACEHLSPWQTVQVARNPGRPVLQDYISMIFRDFIELHGDRRISDDRAIIGGFVRIGKHNVMLIGHNKGKNVEENMQRNFGMARPEGYRKALRLMKLAEKYNLPVVTFIDTMGAYPGLDAEERGQAEAIARNLTEMARLTVPIICIIAGEGGSGGALGIGVGDVILMLANSIYSVISPEGCASILWRDGAYAEKASEALKITAKSLRELGVVDEIIAEPGGAAHHNPEQTAAEVKKAIVKHLKRLQGRSTSRLINKRFEKYSKTGMFTR